MPSRGYAGSDGSARYPLGVRDDEAIRGFWERSRGERPAEPVPDAWAFGDGPEMADRLGALVVDGVKTATSGALWEYEHTGEALPAVGDLSIVLDGRGAPLCLIEITEVHVLAFDQVPADIAHDEGEGDRSLASWREAHWAFFSRSLPRIGREPSMDMPLVCERFRVLARA